MGGNKQNLGLIHITWSVSVSVTLLSHPHLDLLLFPAAPHVHPEATESMEPLLSSLMVQILSSVDRGQKHESLVRAGWLHISSRGSPIIKIMKGWGGGKEDKKRPDVQSFDVDCCFCYQIPQFWKSTEQKAFFLSSFCSCALSIKKTLQLLWQH